MEHDTIWIKNSNDCTIMNNILVQPLLNLWPKLSSVFNIPNMVNLQILLWYRPMDKAAWCMLHAITSPHLFSDGCKWALNTLRPRQNGRRDADDVFKCIFLNENIWIFLKISLKFVPKVPIYNIPALVQILAWRPSGDKPLSEPMMVSLLMHICVTRPQGVKWNQFQWGTSSNGLMASKHNRQLFMTE